MIFEVTIGFSAGYAHDHTVTTAEELKTMTTAYQQAAQDWYESDPKHETYGIYPSAVATTSTTIYQKKWGCPEGGEATVTFTGAFNPSYLQNGISVEAAQEIWQSGVRHVVEAVMRHLDQKTATLVFREVQHMEYLCIDL